MEIMLFIKKNNENGWIYNQIFLKLTNSNKLNYLLKKKKDNKVLVMTRV